MGLLSRFKKSRGHNAVEDSPAVEETAAPAITIITTQGNSILDSGQVSSAVAKVPTITIVNRKFDVNTSIHHYMPSRFPFAQNVCEEDVDNFRHLWQDIYNDNTLDNKGRTKLAVVFEIFYSNLFNRSEKFRDYFGGNVKERCRILARQLNFFTTLKLDATLPTIFYELGKLHKKLGISNWMYAMFVETLLESIAAVAGEKATKDRMYSAAKVVSFCLFALLKYTLEEDNLRRSEINVNFRDARVEDIINQIHTTRYKRSDD